MPCRRCLQLGWLAVVLIGLLGCGSNSAAPVGVKGRVWYRGEPLPGGVIVFVPDEERGTTGSLVKGTILPDGTYSLDGDIAAGWYRVAIAPKSLPSTSTATVANPYPGPSPRYRNPLLSGLIGEVKAASDNAFDYTLDDA